MTRRHGRSAGAAVLASGAPVLVAALLLAGCGPPAESVNLTTKKWASPSGPVGSALAVSDSSGTKLNVIVVQVIDPANGANAYSAPNAGSHFVGVKLRVSSTATKTYKNNANNETTITLSNGRTQVADFNPIAGCGNFDNGQVTLASGASTTGCVTFQVPDGVGITTVRYGNNVFPGTSAVWRVSS